MPPKPWKQFRDAPSQKESPVALAESKIFGAELSGNAPDVDLHGMDIESGVHEVDLFLHQAFMRGDDVVKIIHGRGSGKLRDAVHVFLRQQPIVEFFRDSFKQAETAGVTYVVLKKKE